MTLTQKPQNAQNDTTRTRREAESSSLVNLHEEMKNITNNAENISDISEANNIDSFKEDEVTTEQTLNSWPSINQVFLMQKAESSYSVFKLRIFKNLKI